MSQPPYRRNPQPKLVDHWAGTNVPRYLTDEQVDALNRNPEYTTRGEECPVCLNTGKYTYLGEEFECPDDSFGHPMLRLAKLYWLHNIPLQYQQLKFADWPTKPKSYIEARAAMEGYIDSFARYRMNGTGLTFYSKTLGTGKTWGATSVLKALVREGYDGWFAQFPFVKSYYEIDDPKERKFQIDRIQGAEVLVLDEVTEPWTDAQRNFYADKLEELIRPRTNANLATIITTNMTPPELEKVFPRVFSLMSAKNIEIPLAGIDARAQGDIWRRNAEITENREALTIE